MEKDEMMRKAIWIQYPLKYDTYKEYNIDKVNRLPLTDKNMMYLSWYRNENHFTTEYHIKYAIPLLCEKLKIGFNENDFVLDKRMHGIFDISILKPRKYYEYEVFGFTRNEHFDNLTFNDITSNDSTKPDITDYHRLYKYSHECSRLINKTLDSNRKLFISGDSHMVPLISFLSCFFKEVWYFDNRENMTLHQEWSKENFTDVIIEINHLNIGAYINKNFK